MEEEAVEAVPEVKTLEEPSIEDPPFTTATEDMATVTVIKNMVDESIKNGNTSELVLNIFNYLIYSNRGYGGRRSASRQGSRDNCTGKCTNC